MKMYIVIALCARFGIDEGILELTDEQFSARAHNLEKVKKGKGLYKITGPVEFKKGEKLGFNGKYNKYMKTVLRDLSEKPAEDTPPDGTGDGDPPDGTGDGDPPDGTGDKAPK